MINKTKTAADLIAQCDHGAWLVVLGELRRGASLVMLDAFPRYALNDRREIYGPTLSAGYVGELARQGVLSPAGQLRYRLARRVEMREEAA